MLILKKKKRWKKDSILIVAYKSLYKKQYGNQRIPANLWQFFFLRGFRKLANVLKIWQKMKTICHEFLGGCCYRLWNQFELRNTGYFTTNPPAVIKCQPQETGLTKPASSFTKQHTTPSITVQEIPIYIILTFFTISFSSLCNILKWSCAF